VSFNEQRCESTCRRPGNPGARISASMPQKKYAADQDALHSLSVHVRRCTQGLVTDRPSIVMQAEDGTVIEVFEWASKQAINDAHSNSEVQQMWAEYAEVCEYVPASSVAEIKQLSSEFAPLSS
jgi:hypothetical protein